MEGGFARIETIPTSRAFNPCHTMWVHSTTFNFANSPMRIQTLQGLRDSVLLVEVGLGGATNMISSRMGVVLIQQ
jgi:hypothetical protein